LKRNASGELVQNLIIWKMPDIGCPVILPGITLKEDMEVIE